MDQKFEFINEWKSSEYSFKSLCESFGIAKSLGYRLCSRYKQEGDAGLNPRSKAPLNIANRSRTEIEIALCERSLKHLRLGADKLLTLLEDDFERDELPAVSTAHQVVPVIWRHGSGTLSSSINAALTWTIVTDHAK